MKVLAIETSCDETAIAIIEAKATEDLRTGASPVFSVLGNALHSQTETHAEYGGVFPALAKREHVKNILPILNSALGHAKKNGLAFSGAAQALTDGMKGRIAALLERERGLSEGFINFIQDHPVPEIDAIAVTAGPGLEPALWVGISFAKALAAAWKKPLIPVNHMEGHIVSVLLSGPESDERNSDIKFPALALLISGGHTELVEISGWHSYKIAGRTLDDAVGEAFDKVARILGLPYPGGPHVSTLADEDRSARPVLDKGRSIILPRPMLASPNLDLSFSGLKTAVLYLVRDLKAAQKGREKGSEEIDHVTKTQIAREFEDAATDVLAAKTKKALKNSGSRTLILGGGVVANRNIRRSFETLASESGIDLLVPPVDLSTDNAVMIGIAGALRMLNGHPDKDIPVADIKAEGSLSL